MNEVHYESYQEKDKMLLKVLDENGNITDIEATKKEVHEKHLWHQEVAYFFFMHFVKYISLFICIIVFILISWINNTYHTISL